MQRLCLHIFRWNFHFLTFWKKVKSLQKNEITMFTTTFYSNTSFKNEHKRSVCVSRVKKTATRARHFKLIVGGCMLCSVYVCTFFGGIFTFSLSEKK